MPGSAIREKRLKTTLISMSRPRTFRLPSTCGRWIPGWRLLSNKLSRLQPGIHLPHVDSKRNVRGLDIEINVVLHLFARIGDHGHYRRDACQIRELFQALDLLRRLFLVKPSLPAALHTRISLLEERGQNQRWIGSGLSSYLGPSYVKNFLLSVNVEHGSSSLGLYQVVQILAG